jgi:serine/threonine-protein kinase RsbW
MADTRREPVRLDLPADPRYFRLAAACVAELVASASPPGEAMPQPASEPPGAGVATVAVSAVSHDLQLAVQEICANIATHAYRGHAGCRFVLEMGIDDGVFTAEFRDRGEPFDPDGAADPDLEEGQVHGYGLYLIRALVDEMTYHFDAGENCWRLVKRLP